MWKFFDTDETLVGKVLTIQALKPKFDSQNPYKNLGMVACACNLRAGEASVQSSLLRQPSQTGELQV